MATVVNLYPARFETGIRKITVLNPAFGRSEGFQGNARDYPFMFQTGNALALNQVLKENATELGPTMALTYPGNKGWADDYKPCQLTRFLVCSADGRLLWEKYEGKASGGGCNKVYVARRRMNLSVFLALTKQEQRALLSGDEVYIGLMGFRPYRFDKV